MRRALRWSGERTQTAMGAAVAQASRLALFGLLGLGLGLAGRR